MRDNRASPGGHARPDDFTLRSWQGSEFQFVIQNMPFWGQSIANHKPDCRE